MNRLPVAAVLFLACTTPLAAQGPAPAFGQRVRVTTSAPNTTRIGTWRGADQANVNIQVDSTALAIPRGSIVRIEQSMGRKPNVAGGIVGLLLGLGVGGALGCLANPDDYGVYCGGQDDTKVIVGAALGGIAGATAGALLFKRESWRAVTLNP